MAESSSKRVENTVGKGEIARYDQRLTSIYAYRPKPLMF